MRPCPESHHGAYSSASGHHPADEVPWQPYPNLEKMLAILPPGLGCLRRFVNNTAAPQFFRYSPNWIFVLAYNKILSKYSRTKIKRDKRGWLIYGEDKGDSQLLSPTPKFVNVKLEHFEGKFERFIKIEPGDTVLDVGACIGDTTIFMGIKAGDKGKIIAVEPSPINVKYLKLNLANFKHVRIIEKAAWNKEGELELHIDHTLTGHSLISHIYHKAGKGHWQVQVDTLDNMLGDTRVDFAKIDAQNAEVQVLEGADRFLKTTRKLIVETHDRTTEQLRTYPRVLEILKQYGYETILDNDGIVHAWR